MTAVTMPSPKVRPSHHSLIEGADVSEQSLDAKEGIMCNSGFLNGLTVKEAIPAAIDYVEKHGIGHRKINYRIRDAIFSRQRYWGSLSPFITRMASPRRCRWRPCRSRCRR